MGEINYVSYLLPSAGAVVGEYISNTFVVKYTKEQGNALQITHVLLYFTII